MSKAAWTIFVFSLYLFVLGFVLVAIPNTLLTLFQLAETNEIWVRVVGMLVLIIGYYYLTAARHELIPMIRATVVGRVAVLVFLATFVLLGLAPPVLVLFGIIDLAAAIWTAFALRT